MSKIKDLKKTSGPFKSCFMVKSCIGGVSNNSKPYLNIVLQDITGTIEAKKWDVVSGDEEILTPGNIVEIEGTVHQYRGVNQIKINSASSIDSSSVDLDDFIPSCPIEKELMLMQLDAMIDMIENENIKKITEHLIKNNYEKYTVYPAAAQVHHAFAGGILFHSISICNLAIKVAEQYPFLNRDYLIAGSLLHDLGKTIELSGCVATTYTDEGKLLGHISIGAMMIDEAAKELNIVGEEVLILKHIILSHHGNPEFGSPVQPKTCEAFVVHSLDDLDSKLNILETSLKDLKVGEYSSKNIYLDGRQFKKTK